MPIWDESYFFVRNSEEIGILTLIDRRGVFAAEILQKLTLVSKNSVSRMENCKPLFHGVRAMT